MMSTYFECLLCNHTGSKIHMLEHFIRAHVEGSRAPWSCSLCGFKAISKQALNNHEGHFIHKKAAQRYPPSTKVTYIKSEDPYEVRVGQDIIPIPNVAGRGKKRKINEVFGKRKTLKRLPQNSRHDNWNRQPSYDGYDSWETPDMPSYDDQEERNMVRYDYHHEQCVPQPLMDVKLTPWNRGTDARSRSQENMGEYKPMSHQRETNQCDSLGDQENLFHKEGCEAMVSPMLAISNTSSNDETSKLVNNSDSTVSPKRSVSDHDKKSTAENSPRKSPAKSSAQSMRKVNSLPPKHSSAQSTTPERVPASSSTTEHRRGTESNSPKLAESNSSSSKSSRRESSDKQDCSKAASAPDRKRHRSVDQSAEVGSTSSGIRKERKDVSVFDPHSKALKHMPHADEHPSMSLESGKLGAEPSVGPAQTVIEEEDEEEEEEDDLEEGFPDAEMLEQRVTELIQALEPLKNISKALIALDHHMRRMMPMMEILTKDIQSKTKSK